MRIHADPLTDFATAILDQAGGQPAFARKVAQRLVAANLTGHDSHGVGMIPAYVEGIQAGQLNAAAEARLIEEKGPFLLVDGQQGFGQVVTEQAMEMAIARAKEQHIAVLSLRNSFHLGRLGDWGAMAAEAGLIGILYANVLSPNSLVAPFGGSTARFTTNPYCTAIPATAQTPMLLLDMATSQIAMGKARVAHLSGKPVPPGSVIDATGAPTTDPAVMFEEPKGALTTMGAHKGFGLAILCDILGGSFSGGGANLPERVVEGRIINNLFAIVFDPDVYGGAAEMGLDIDAYTQWVKSSPPGPGSDGVLFPGDPERLAQADRGANGIPLDDGTWTELVTAAETAGLSAVRIAELAKTA